MKRNTFFYTLAYVSFSCLMASTIHVPFAAASSQDSLIIANTAPMYDACMQRCADTSQLGSLTRRGCLQGCNEMRRTFPLRTKKFRASADCINSVDGIELRRDLLIKEKQEWCTDQSQHIHVRKGCKDAVEVFYNAATTDNLCGTSKASAPSDYAYSPRTTGNNQVTTYPSTGYQPQAAAPHVNQYTTQTTSPQATTKTLQASPVTSPSYTSVQPATVQETPPSTSALWATPLVDTPKYQTPQEEAKSLKKGKKATSKPQQAAPAPAKKTDKQTNQSSKSSKPSASQSKSGVSSASAFQKTVPTSNATAPANSNKEIPLEKDAPYVAPEIQLAPPSVTPSVSPAPHSNNVVPAVSPRSEEMLPTIPPHPEQLPPTASPRTEQAPAGAASSHTLQPSTPSPTVAPATIQVPPQASTPQTPKAAPVAEPQVPYSPPLPASQVPPSPREPISAQMLPIQTPSASPVPPEQAQPINPISAPTPQALPQTSHPQTPYAGTPTGVTPAAPPLREIIDEPTFQPMDPNIPLSQVPPMASQQSVIIATPPVNNTPALEPTVVSPAPSTMPTTPAIAQPAPSSSLPAIATAQPVPNANPPANSTTLPMVNTTPSTPNAAQPAPLTDLYPIPEDTAPAPKGNAAVQPSFSDLTKPVAPNE